MNNAMLKFVDRLVGRLAVAMLPRPKRAYCKSPRKILLIRPGGIGDAILLIPTIRTLKETFPDCKIDILAENRNAAVFALAFGIGTVYRYDSLVHLCIVLRTNYCVVIDTEQWYRLSAVVARVIQAPIRIGFASNDRSRLFTDAIPYAFEKYEAETFQSLLHPFGISMLTALQLPFLCVSKVAESSVSSLLAKFRVERFVAVFPGASVREKRWQTERFVSLVAKLVAHWPVVVVGGLEDVSIGEEIAKVGGVNLAGKTSLAETAAVISRADVLVSGDSGVLHLAVGLDVPTVALFGPSSVAKWAPRGVCDKVLTASLACSPCSRYGTIPQCPNGVRCMHDISVDQVLLAVESVIAESAAMKKKCGIDKMVDITHLSC